MSGDQEQDTVAGGDRALQSAIDRVPCAVKAMPMQVERAVGLDPARPQAAIPAAVERVFLPFLNRDGHDWRRVRG